MRNVFTGKIAGLEVLGVERDALIRRMEAQLRDADERFDQERRTNQDLVTANGKLQGTARRNAERASTIQTRVEQIQVELRRTQTQLDNANV